MVKKLDTKDFIALSPEEYKKQTEEKWTDSPCGSNYSAEEYLTKEYFEEIEEHRYSSHPWINEAIDSFNLKGKDVLEIGFGMGTDHLNMARRGGNMNGIDLTRRHLDITKTRLELYGLKSNLINGDAENLPYNDNTFDFIYSLGVIHHSPDTEKIISEINRVLKPGGKCYVAVYHKNSVFFWWSVFIVNYLIRGGWKKRTLKQQISLVEYPGTNENLVIKLYKKNEFDKLFDKFYKKESHIKHLIPTDLEYISGIFSHKNKPTKFLTLMGNKFGWYVVVEATK